MAQYRTGNVSVTTNSQTITGVETEFLENVVPGGIFTIVGSGIAYMVAAVESDTELTLTANYAGASQTGLAYAISNDRTVALGLPIINKGDIETATLLRVAFQMLDELVGFDTNINDPQEHEALIHDGEKWVNKLVDVVGTITAGTWNGSVIGVPYGGTGLSTTPTNGKLLIGNGTNYTLATLTEGTGISITNGAGSITVANAGVTQLTGTANQVSVSGSTGSITLSLPQSIAAASTPTFAQVTLSNSPSNATDAATKSYVDAVAAGLKVKEGVRVRTGVNQNVSAFATSSIDGVTINNGDRILLVGQSTQSQNGIWIFNGTSNALTRPSDFDSSSPTNLGGTTVFVNEGTTFGNTYYVLTTNNPITVDTTNQVWAQFGGPGTYSAGTGITLSGSAFSLTAPVSSSLGGTGVNNGSSTITLGGSLTTSGAHTLTLTTTGNTNVTLPTSGTLVNSSVATLSSLASIGTITTGTWNGTVIGAVYGGTGQSSYTTGDMIYASATNTLSKLAIGTEGHALFSISGVPTWSATPGLATFANPINTVGLSAKNGSASTVMRSDAAPALDQAISPTWTSAHTFSSTLTANADLISGGIIRGSVGTAISAAGSDQAGATALTKNINDVTTVSSNTGVRLPDKVGAHVTVMNHGANALKVYPISSASINALSNNVAFTLDVGAVITFAQISSTKYYTIGATYG